MSGPGDDPELRVPDGHLEIRDLRIVGTHGVLPEERERPQPFSLDIDAWVDTASAGCSDDLADTVDYGALALLAAEVVVVRSFRLLEALADTVAGELLDADPRITQVAVTVRKLRPPLPLDVASVGVAVVRRRPQP